MVRERIHTEIKRAEPWRRPDLAAEVASARSAFAFMDAADTTRNLRDFLTSSEASDRAFGDSWREAAPDLAEHLDSFSSEASSGAFPKLRRWWAGSRLGA